MPRAVLTRIAIAGARAMVPAVALGGPAAAQLAAVERVVATAEARGVRTGVAVCEADGRVLYRHRAAEAFAPASNMKLLTVAAVLDGLSADHVFRTVFRLERGALVVDASGDPNWIHGGPDAPRRVFASVARELRARDVHRLTDVELRAGSYVGPDRPAGWPRDQLYAYYCAPTGPFVLEQGAFVVRIEAGDGPEALAALLAPPSGYELRGSIDLTSNARDAAYGAIDEGGAVRVRGRFYRRAPPVEIRTSMRDPERWFRDTLVHQLAVGGVRVDPAFDAGGDGPVYAHESPLQPALRRVLEDSSNFDAEQCLRVLGAETRGDGSLAGGIAALRQQLEGLVGRLPQGVVLADGSGLSAANRVTPGLLVVAMFRTATGPHGDVQRDCLPVAGRTGTLEDRFAGTDLVGHVRAKTGWIRGASSLSGLVELPGGGARWFSILMNYDRDRGGLNRELKRMQEEIVAAVAAIDPSR